MYQSFTGSSRRPRQVNLSGRNTNPFAATSAATSGPQQAIQSAHQDRQLRQQQRQQLNAAKIIQKTWRGYSSRGKTKETWRRQWDASEHATGDTTSYTNQTESLAQLRKLLLFFNPRLSTDIDRLVKYASRQRESVEGQANVLNLSWRAAYLRLETSCLAALSTAGLTSPQGDTLLHILPFIVQRIPEESARISRDYYITLVRLATDAPSDAFYDSLFAPLRPALIAAYEGLVASYLTCPHELGVLRRLADNLDIALFTQAAANASSRLSLDASQRLWLLGQYIHIVHVAHEALVAGRSAEPFDTFPHIPTIARLLASLAEDIAPDATVLDMDNFTYHQSVLAGKSGRVPLNKFLHAQIQRLVDQRGIRSLLARPNADPAIAALDSDSDSTQLLAGFALTLLRMFPLRADDIRMWLYLGPSGQARPGASIPAIAYFWRGARKTKLFDSIFRDPRASIDLLTVAKPALSSWQPPRAHKEQLERNASDWRVMIVFLELYTFVLKIMDDEEFLGGDPGAGTRMSNNALPLSDIKDLTIFLKNLGFAMYYYAQDISDSFQPSSETLTPASLARHFGGSQSSAGHQPEPEPAPQQTSVAGIMGMSLDYLKGLITSLLRAVYERDSRRQFLPKGHWLMTSKFDMSNFIQAVVGEEERRSQLQQQDEDDESEDSDMEPDAYTLSHSGRSQTRFRRVERDQRKLSRKRYLQVVAPRLEILQNMPFLIPFETRVEVFREFVRLDQAKRRGGFVDSDHWRSMVMFRNPDGHNELNRHHAVVRRRYEFQDAFNSFYQLGADLKEPIQITFKDEFDIVEAGIDGGGVTKEFLTSVTSQAFDPSQRYFKENAQHLLYPNSTSLEEMKDNLKHAQGLDDTHPDVQSSLVNLLRQYEFLGRIVGKCLYEGILVDIGFAGFFLTQWSLFKAGPSGQSAYRPTINDLRDLDEGLYKGLLDLKYYPGNVEEDIPLTFTVIDEVSLGNGEGFRTIEGELTPGGADQAVTNENRLLYISLMARWRLVRQSYRQTNNFLKGLSSIIEPGWLSMFNQLELQTLVGGAASSIDVADLRRNTQYGGVYVIGDDQQEHPSVKLFWEVMESIQDEDRRRVLKFVTSTPRAPLLGFGSLTPKFSIRDSGADESRFPTTSTCVNLLKLPRYKSASVLREKLLYAVNSGAGFDLS